MNLTRARKSCENRQKTWSRSCSQDTATEFLNNPKILVHLRETKFGKDQKGGWRHRTCPNASWPQKTTLKARVRGKGLSTGPRIFPQNGSKRNVKWFPVWVRHSWKETKPGCKKRENLQENLDPTKVAATGPSVKGNVLGG